MDNEVIYEAFGEVKSMDKKNGSKISVDEGFEAPEEENISNVQPLFSNDMTDDAVVEHIFNCCDLLKTGFVRASTLVEFLLKYSSESHEIKEISQVMAITLDPTDTNPEISVENFQSALKFCINKMTVKPEDSWLLEVSSHKLQLLQKSNSSINMESVSSSGSSSLELQCLDVKELQHQFNRLQDENNLLQEQVVDVEESNVSLRLENSQLKSKITKVELAITEIGHQSLLLQDDNGQLQGRVMQLKDDLQKMTLHYEGCRKELQDKVNELENLQLNRSMGEERCKNLIDTIRLLEEIIRTKEEELEAKDKEVQRISQDLMEQQLLSDPVVNNKFDRNKGHEVGGETLAAELQSSLGDTPWKKQMGSVPKPDFIHPVAWETILNEPECEDEQINRSFSSFANTCGIKEKESETDKNTNQVTSNRVINCNSSVVSGQIFEPRFEDMIHSTPICKNAPVQFNWKEKETHTMESRKSRLLNLSRHCVRILCWLIFMVLICAIVLFLLLSATDLTATDYWGFPNYQLEAASSYYSSSMWSKVFHLLKPFCSIEYHGCPPV